MTILDPGFGGLIGGGGGASNNNSGGEEKGEEEEDPLTPEEVREKLFDTSSLTDEEEKELDEMLQEIINNCLGEELCRQLINKGNTIVIGFNEQLSNSHFGTKNGRHIIELNRYRSDVLLHEMTHAYQGFSRGSVQYNNNMAYIEIEAYIATFFFLNNISTGLEFIEIQNNYGPYCIRSDMAFLQSYFPNIIKNSEVFDPAFFNQVFENAAENYSYTYYNNEPGTTTPGTQFITSLMTLIQNC